MNRTSARWTASPSCRRPHKSPAHTFKEPRSRPQRLPSCSRRFRRGEPHIMATRFRTVNTSFEEFFDPPLSETATRWGSFPSEGAAHSGRLSRIRQSPWRGFFRFRPRRDPFPFRPREPIILVDFSGTSTLRLRRFRSLTPAPEAIETGRRGEGARIVHRPDWFGKGVVGNPSK